MKKIIGKFRIGDIINDRPESLWEQLHEYSGLTKKDFDAYFSEKDKGYAIEITNFELFEEPIDPKELISDFVAPQSFQYIDESVFKHRLSPNKGSLQKGIQIEV
jgi:predicted transcriptional regulator